MLDIQRGIQKNPNPSTVNKFILTSGFVRQYNKLGDLTNRINFLNKKIGDSPYTKYDPKRVIKLEKFENQLKSDIKVNTIDSETGKVVEMSGSKWNKLVGDPENKWKYDPISKRSYQLVQDQDKQAGFGSRGLVNKGSVRGIDNLYSFMHETLKKNPVPDSPNFKSGNRSKPTFRR